MKCVKIVTSCYLPLLFFLSTLFPSPSLPLSLLLSLFLSLHLLVHNPTLSSLFFLLVWTIHVFNHPNKMNRSIDFEEAIVIILFLIRGSI